MSEGNTQSNIPGRGDTSSSVSAPIQISRRRFLQAGGAASAVGLAGCVTEPAQKIVPFVSGDPEQVPGVAVWYRSTCMECSAGCGIQVRTREGRAVKIEGNPDSPVNKGGLCALGQASLQSLYDPDRVRQPLLRKGRGQNGAEFEPISWDAALGRINEALAAAKGKRIFFTGDLPASHAMITEEACAKIGGDRVVFEPLDQVNVAKAAEMAFGVYGVPTYRMAKAEVVLNIGADFLETWVNPCGFARDWADGRRAAKPAKFIHVEPRLSLTGANADIWLSAKPGTEASIVLWMCKTLLSQGKGLSLSIDIRTKIQEAAKSLTASSVAAECGVDSGKLLQAFDALTAAKRSLVLAGGTATATKDPLPLLVAVNLLNLMLGNVGETVEVSGPVKPKTSMSKVVKAIEEMKAGAVDLVFLHATNPVYSLPSELGFAYAANAVRVVGDTKKAGLIVAFASHIDETAELADLILPVHTSLEDWGFTDLGSGSFGVVQPAMQPIFDTKSYGDLVISICGAAGTPAVDQKTFRDFVKDRFLKANGGGDDRFWLEAVERGGVFAAAPASGERVKGASGGGTLSIALKAQPLTHSDKELILFPYPSVKSFDGRAANRPWLQELADPITQVVWDAWAEMNPASAKHFGVEHGDVVTLRTTNGEVNATLFVTPYVREGIVAVPMGQGHTSYGRYAKTVGHGSVFGLLDKAPSTADSLVLLGASVGVSRSRARTELVSVQGSDSQHGRELARTRYLDGTGHQIHDDHGHGAHGGGHHGGEVKQMYHQREHPLYQWGLSIDLAACTGCSACVVACYAENNIPVVGKSVVSQGREMSWIRIERYYDGVGDGHSGEELKVSFMPMMCQHCQNAPCEPVCPVYATYHNEEGLNAMVYNRCVGTRYCSNNCSYKVRRFNWFQYEWPDLLDWQLNPDVTKRTVGVMEKCTFCVQRIHEAKHRAKDLGRMVEDGEIKPACVQSCPTQAIVFGNLKDPNSKVSQAARGDRSYKVLDSHINTQPSVSYLEDIRYKL